MTPPEIEFRDASGDRVNPSTVETGDELTGELRYTVDIDDGSWCRACQRSDCEHAELIDRSLAASGLPREDSEGCDTGLSVERGTVSDADIADSASELPRIDRITQYRAMGETIVGCWFENGARVRFHEQDDGRVSQVLFGAAQPQQPIDASVLAAATSAESCLIELLSAYYECRYSRDPLLRTEWPALSIVLTDDADRENGTEH